MGKYKWFDEDVESFMRNNESYLRNGETLDVRVNAIAKRAFKDIYDNEEYLELFKSYVEQGYISLSTPVWANFGRPGHLSISCFGSYVNDSMDSILYTAAETGMMSKYGGGTSAYLGNVRPRGSKISKGGTTDGSVHFCRLFESVVDVSKQGSTRRGSMAVTLPIDHKDIEEFIQIRHEGSLVQQLFPSVSVTDEWMESLINGDEEKRKVWAKVLQSRQRFGTPFIFFKDNINNNKPQIYKDINSEIVASNLCCEVMLPSTADESFICCLASLNAEKYDEWKNTKVVEVLTAFLDTVLTDFIETASKIPFMERPVKFAKRHRAIGIGVLGFHSYLQKNMIPFESIEAKIFNEELFKTIKLKSYIESSRLGDELGYAPIFDEIETSDTKRRNVTTMAIAPTSSSSFILGKVSQGVEPFRSNFYMRTMAKGKVAQKNKYLEKLLKDKGKDSEEVWESIGLKFGSVQHLDFLTEEEKDVFKTFSEISQIEIVNLAAQRQKHIDQGQSLNLMFHPLTPAKDLNSVVIQAWRNGVKTLYYHHTTSVTQEMVNTLTCKSCEA